MALETIIERLQRYTGMNPGATILFDDMTMLCLVYKGQEAPADG